MAEIDTHIRTPGGWLIPFSDEWPTPVDPDYIEGAIELSVNGVTILDQTMWDYVDQLWSYIARMVNKLATSDSASTYFPDQPIELEFRRVSGRQIVVSCVLSQEKRVAAEQEDIFVASLRKHGEQFFRRMISLVPQRSASYDRDLRRLS